VEILILFFSLLLVSTHVYGQEKSGKDPKNLKIETLTTINKTRTIQLDSVSLQLETVSKEMVKHLEVYLCILSAFCERKM
jgi:hypothetical protein